MFVREVKHTLLTRLKLLQKYGPANPDEGICHNLVIDDSHDINVYYIIGFVEEYSADWPLRYEGYGPYSSSIYPIAGRAESGPKWSGENGIRRAQLIAYLIEKLEAELSESQN